jgi:hypothetical protein
MIHKPQAQESIQRSIISWGKRRGNGEHPRHASLIKELAQGTGGKT